VRRGRPTRDARADKSRRLAEAWGTWAGRQRRSQADLARTISQHLGCTDRAGHRHAVVLLRQAFARWSQLPHPLRKSIAKARAVRDLLHLEEVCRAVVV